MYIIYIYIYYILLKYPNQEVLHVRLSWTACIILEYQCKKSQEPSENVHMLGFHGERNRKSAEFQKRKSALDRQLDRQRGSLLVSCHIHGQFNMFDLHMIPGLS